MNNIGLKSHKPKIYIGTDHAGFVMKEKLVVFLKKLGYEVVDCGAFKYNDADDYPDFIAPVARAVGDFCCRDHPEHRCSHQGVRRILWAPR